MMFRLKSNLKMELSILLDPDVGNAMDEDMMHFKRLPEKTVLFVMILRALSCACQ
jgi:hypothetical protein